MGLVYFHSPLPPQKTGVADYAMELLQELRWHVDLVLVGDEAVDEIGLQLNIPSLRTAAWRKLRGKSKRGTDLYQLGNNGFHKDIYRKAVMFPGVSVVHDLSINGLLLSDPELYPDYVRSMEYEYGPRARRIIRSRERFETFGWQDFLHRNLGLLIDTSQSILVHSTFAERILKRRFPGVAITYAPHHVAPSFAAPKAERSPHRFADFFERNRNSKIIGTFGFITPPKRIDWLVCAARTALDKGAAVALLLAGAPHPDTGIPKLLAEFPRDRVLVTGFLTEEEMLSLMQAVDLHVSLRFPSVGESSGTLTRAIGLGVPSVVLDHESFSDYSAEHVTKIGLSPRVSDDLASVIVAFSADSKPFQQKASAAANWIRKHAALDNSVRKYLDAIDVAAQQGAAKSNYFVDVGKFILEALPARLDASHLQRQNADLGVGLATMVLAAPSVQRIVRGANLDAIGVCVDDESETALEDLEAEYPILPANGPRKRRLFVVACATTISKDFARKCLKAMNASRFDAVIFCLLPAMAVARLPKLPLSADLLADGADCDILIERARKDIELEVTPDMLRSGAHPPSTGICGLKLTILGCEVL